MVVQQCHWAVVGGGSLVGELASRNDRVLSRVASPASSASVREPHHQPAGSECSLACSRCSRCRRAAQRTSGGPTCPCPGTLQTCPRPPTCAGGDQPPLPACGRWGAGPLLGASWLLRGCFVRASCVPPACLLRASCVLSAPSPQFFRCRTLWRPSS